MCTLVGVALPLEPMAEVTWGERFMLARRRSGVRLDQAAALISANVIPTSYGTLVRLEQSANPPATSRQRLIAFCALLVYGINPVDFGLSREDLPEAIDRDRLSDLLKRQFPCTDVRAA